MMRQRSYAWVNVVGLAVGIACTLLLALYVQDEWSYDNFHTDSNRIYRVASNGRLQGTDFNTAETGPLLAGAIQKQLPEVESVIRLANWPTFPIQVDTAAFTERYLLLADSNFFSFFDFRLLVGDASEVLKGDGKLVISETAAKRLFRAPADYSTLFGRQVKLAQGYKATVVGVAADAPKASHFHYSMILSLGSWRGLEENGFVVGKVKTYIKTHQVQTIESLNTALKRFTENEIAVELKQRYDISKESFAQFGNFVELFAQPLTDIHLRSDLENEIEPNNRVAYTYLFGFVALFVTIIACINFVNLSTARSASRAKEVGVRKVVGAMNHKLIFQFLFESYLYTLLSVGLSFLVLVLCLLPFNLVTDKALSLSDLLQPTLLWVILLYILFIGLFAGAYPAFFLTYLSPSQILRGSLRSGVTSHRVRNVLVGFQFVISIALMIATLVVNDQMNYLQEKEYGFNEDRVLNILHAVNLGSRASAFVEEVSKVAGVESASFANRLPPNVDGEVLVMHNDQRKQYLMRLYEMDAAHLKTMGYAMTRGRFFTGDSSDFHSIILNQTAADELNIRDTAQQTVSVFTQPNVATTFKLIGIVRDFHFRAANYPIEPLVLLQSRAPNLELAVRVAPDKVSDAISSISRLWNDFSGGAPFEYSWVKDNFRKSYQHQARVREVLLLFTIVAVALAALGVLGLAAYAAEHRSKEVGIRKALGAQRLQIVAMISKDFALLVGVAFLVTAPVAWILMELWLQQFPYHVNVSWWSILAAGFVTVAITFAAVSSQALKAASVDPVKSLKTE
jgi:putative ABC transport system permease protein